MRIPQTFVTDLKIFKFFFDGGGKFLSGVCCFIGLALIWWFFKVQLSNRVQVVNFNTLHGVYCREEKTSNKDTSARNDIYPLLKKSVLDVRIVGSSTQTDKALKALSGSMSTVTSIDMDLRLSDGRE